MCQAQGLDHQFSQKSVILTLFIRANLLSILTGAPDPWMFLALGPQVLILLAEGRSPASGDPRGVRSCHPAEEASHTMSGVVSL